MQNREQKQKSNVVELLCCILEKHKKKIENYQH